MAERGRMAHRIAAAGLVLAALAAAGCGEFVRSQGRSPVQLVIRSLVAARGSSPNELQPTLRSDVLTNGSVFNDFGQVTLALVLKNPGVGATPNQPSPLNEVTITRYRVVYRRTDGRNTPGSDVPYPIDSAMTFTVPATGEVSAGFQIVRHSQKQEAPLAALAANNDIISTVAEVSFFGRDQAGNDVSAVGSIGIDFGNFAD